MTDEIYLDLRVKVNCVSLFSCPTKVLNLADPASGGVGIYSAKHQPSWYGGDRKEKISIHGVTIESAELAESSYIALAELGNLRAIEVTEERINGLNSYLDELKSKNS